jgi:UDP-N-acetylglucosamine 2-epimerase (non-hydrolysing)
MKIAFVIGTRPEIIKCSPIIRECERLSLDYFILHTGQHYSYNMSGVFFEQLQLPIPKYNLNIGSGSHGEQTGKMIAIVEKILLKESPSVVLVQGDTNTTLSGAIAAAKLHIKVGHVEAGLRSFDRRMPEEINRILVDHCSEYLFAPTAESERFLINEGLLKEKIFTVGNTVVDAIHQNLKLAKSNIITILRQTGIKDGKFVLATSHRQENVDNKSRFENIIKGLQMIQQEFKIPILYPIHPRARKQLEIFGIHTNGLTLIEPLDYLAFLQLESNAKLVLTDSGGVQEETCILGIPCVTIRDNTERPETLKVGANILAGTVPKKILKAARQSLVTKKTWRNPFGKGNTASEIIKILVERQ